MYILSVALCRLDDPAIRTPSPPDSAATPTFRAHRQREAKRLSVLVFGVRTLCEVGREASRSFAAVQVAEAALAGPPWSEIDTC